MTFTSVAERLAVVLSLPVLTTLVCPDRVSNPDLPHARWTDLVKVFTIQYISLWTLKSQCVFSDPTHKTKEKTTFFWQKRWFFYPWSVTKFNLLPWQGKGIWMTSDGVWKCSNIVKSSIFSTEVICYISVQKSTQTSCSRNIKNCRINFEVDDPNAIVIK